jgi:transcriptional regulator with XRE-family HTH domain
VARYERGSATPSWETLERLAAACGQRIQLNVEPLPEPHDVELSKYLLRLTPEERLKALPRYARLHNLAPREDDQS